VDYSTTVVTAQICQSVTTNYHGRKELLFTVPRPFVKPVNAWSVIFGLHAIVDLSMVCDALANLDELDCFPYMHM
jgi:hypothetical protein